MMLPRPLRIHHCTSEPYRFFGRAAELALLDQARLAMPPDAGMTLEQRPSVPAPIDYDEVVRKIVSGQGQEAVSELRAPEAPSR